MLAMQEERVQGFRLSPQQRRLWGLRQAVGAPLRVQAVARIEGDLETARLWSAVDRVVARTEILRTCFRSLAGMTLPLQVVREELPPHRLERDLSALPAEARRAAADALLREEREAAYSPASDSPLRVLLVSLEPGLRLLAVTLPELCADRAGAAGLLREIALAYGAGDAAEPEMQYVDLAEWQNDLLDAEETRAGRDHWASADLSRQGGLGCELPAGGEGPWRPASLPVPVSPGAVSRLARLARESDLPVASFLLAAWSLLLGRRRGGEAPLGLVCDGRRYRELADAVGPFSRVLPLEPVTPGASLRVAAGQAEAAARQARAFQESFDWERLQGGGNGGPAVHPFLSWAFSFEEAPESISVRDVLFTPLEIHGFLEPFELLLAVTGRPGALGAELLYDPLRFDRPDVERLVEQLSFFLDELSGSPDSPAADLPVLGPAEARELLRSFNATASPEPLPAPSGVHEIIAGQAARRPEALAVVGEDLALTYAELDRRANRLARRLLDLGIGPESRVALCAERSPLMVVGLLGILKAGGAYVPLDPDQPRVRLALLLEEVGAAALVTQRRLAAELPAGPWPLVCLEDGPAEEAVPPSGPAPGNLAYVLFTSGSTGRPKGVAVEHRQLLNYVRAVSERLELPGEAVYAMVTTFAADLGHTMAFPALCGGGCLLVASQEQARDPEALAGLFARRPVDCLKIVPSHLAALLGGSRPERLVPRLRLVLGGEASRRELVLKVRELAPGCRVFNHYGPTETTVGALTHAASEGGWDDRWGSLPLGRPLANTRVYLLDGRLQPVPAWVPGEVYIGGAGVARGYLGQPALTAERFVPDPVGGESGARLYRTGDLARHLPGAGLEFLGRADHQVKIRGFRIELGEIEAEIRRHPAVREVVVLLREDRPGDRRLAAYVVPAPAGSLSVEDLRSHLARHLPEAMVPSSFVFLTALPLTANGKVDRQALPEPPPEGGAAEPAAGRTPTEELLAGLWAQVLRREDVGPRDNFFHLGGHSLLATQLFSRMREAFKVELPLSVLFEEPTLVGLAGRVDAALRTGAGVQAPPITPGPRHDHLPLSFAQQRHWFLQQLAPGSSLYNLRSSVLLEGHLDLGVLTRTLREVVSRHEILRTSFPVVDGHPVQRISPSPDVQVPVVDLRHLPEEMQRERGGRLMEEERERPFDLERAPLLRVLLLRLGDREHLAVMTMHHIVADGWSMGVLVNELSTLYGAFAAGRPSPLRPLAVQYADFSRWQREWLRDEVLEAHLGYWRRQLAEAPAGLRLPYDFPRPARPSVRSRRLPFAIPEPVADGLKELARETGTTLFQVLLAAFQVLLHGLSGQTDIVVGAPIANRNRLETEGLIGCFINALALRGDLSGNPSFLDLLPRVRAMVVEAHTHEDLPFDKLVEDLNPARGEGQAPFFQVVFSYGTPRQALALPGLTLHRVEAENELDAKYDLILFVAPAEGGMTGILTYSTDLFKPATVARVAIRLEALLRGIVARPGASLRELLEEADQEERRAALARAEELRQARRSSLPSLERRTARGARTENHETTSRRGTAT